MATLNAVMSPYEVAVPPHLAAELELEPKTGLQRQGDVIVVPQRPGALMGLAPIPTSGIPVVRGESGGNTHLLVGAGQWVANASRNSGVMGTLVVENEPSYLLHPEHGALAIGPGQYRICRQREQADEVRLVAD